jgi:hypothetical protein
MFSVDQVREGRPTAIHLEVHDPNGVQGVGVHQLAFAVQVDFSWTGDVTVVLHDVVLDIAAARYEEPGGLAEDRHTKLRRRMVPLPVGRCGLYYPDEFPLHVRNSGGSIGFLATLTLADSQLDALESLRGGGDMKLWASAYLRVSEDPSTEVEPERVRFSLLDVVPQSVWVDKVLNRLSRGRRVVFDVPIPQEEQSPVLYRAAQKLTDARQRSSEGDNAGALGACRDALAAMTEAVGLTAEADAELARWSSRDEAHAEMLDQASWLAVLRHVVRRFIAQGEENDPRGQVGAPDAQAVITILAGLVQASSATEALDLANARSILEANSGEGQAT